ncbi:hypothetical protein V6N13_106512 [Hibiscus sabdariffa]
MVLPKLQRNSPRSFAHIARSNESESTTSLPCGFDIRSRGLGCSPRRYLYIGPGFSLCSCGRRLSVDYQEITITTTKLVDHMGNQRICEIIPFMSVPVHSTGRKSCGSSSGEADHFWVEETSFSAASLVESDKR